MTFSANLISVYFICVHVYTRYTDLDVLSFFTVELLWLLVTQQPDTVFLRKIPYTVHVLLMHMHRVLLNCSLTLFLDLIIRLAHIMFRSGFYFYPMTDTPDVFSHQSSYGYEYCYSTDKIRTCITNYFISNSYTYQTSIRNTVEHTKCAICVEVF